MEKKTLAINYADLPPDMQQLVTSLLLSTLEDQVKNIGKTLKRSREGATETILKAVQDVIDGQYDVRTHSIETHDNITTGTLVMDYSCTDGVCQTIHLAVSLTDVHHDEVDEEAPPIVKGEDEIKAA